MQGLYPCFISW